MQNQNTYNPYDVLKLWDKLNGYKEMAKPDKFTHESEGNLYLQTLYHKNYATEREYMRGGRTLSADEYFCGGKQ